MHTGGENLSTEGKTIGEILRAAREEKKLTVEQVNRETRISVQTIRALERDDFGSFASETYLKGFLRNYAEFLGLDGNALWSMVATRASGGGVGNTPSWEIEGSLKEEKLGAPRVVRRLILPLLVILVLLFVWMWLREKRKAEALRSDHAVESVVEMGAAG
jgi:cytoskeletal protein RodZ